MDPKAPFHLAYQRRNRRSNSLVGDPGCFAKLRFLWPSGDEQKSVGENSHYNTLASGLLPPLGSRSNRQVKLRPYIISPYNPRYRYGRFFTFRYVSFFTFSV